MTDDELIAKYIIPHPGKPWQGKEILRESLVSVWAIVGAWIAADGAVDDVAREYGASVDEVRAALAFYRKHKPLMDARLLVEKAVWSA